MRSRTGNELFYRRGFVTTTTQGTNLMAVDITTDRVPRIENERVLPMQGFRVFFGYRDFGIMPDGAQFLMLFSEGQQNLLAEPPRPQINVVLNWFEELTERVPVP